MQFGNDKKDGLCDECLSCSVLNLCYGGCPKHRFSFSRRGTKPQNYLCEGYKKFFFHILPYIDIIKKLINERKPITDLMTIAGKI